MRMAKLTRCLTVVTVYNTKENWLKSRGKGIGGSEASAVIGKNPYKSNMELWEEKVGIRKPEDIDNKPYIIYGNQAEELLSKLFALDYPEYELTHNTNYAVHYNDKYPFIYCTRDNDLVHKATGKKGALEIKTTEILNSMHKEKWDDQVPENYYIQLLQYFATDSELEFVWLKAQIKYDFGDGNIKLTTKHYYFTREQCQEDIDYLISKEIEFWQKNVIEKVRPPRLLPQI